MARTYLPTKGSEYHAFVVNLNAQLKADAAGFGASAEESAALDDATGAFVAAYALAETPETRTRVNIEARDDARKALTAVIRPLVKRLQGWSGMTNAKRALLQITIADNEPTPVPVPETSPVIQIESVVGNRVTLRLRDADGSRRGRPPFVTGATVFSYVGEAAPGDISAWTFEGNIKDTFTVIDIPSAVAPGSKVFFTSFWRNNRDESGPATPPVSTNVQGGSVSKMAA